MTQGIILGIFLIFRSVVGVEEDGVDVVAMNEEVHKLKGGPKREVCMLLPRATATQPSGAAILRQIPGFERFNEAAEALEMLKGGFGLADAPNLFTTRVDNVFKQQSLLPTMTDQKIYLKHATTRLIYLCVFVDAVAFTCERRTSKRRRDQSKKGVASAIW